MPPIKPMRTEVIEDAFQKGDRVTWGPSAKFLAREHIGGLTPGLVDQKGEFLVLSVNEGTATIRFPDEQETTVPLGALQRSSYTLKKSKQNRKAA